LFGDGLLKANPNKGRGAHLRPSKGNLKKAQAKKCQKKKRIRGLIKPLILEAR